MTGLKRGDKSPLQRREMAVVFAVFLAGRLVLFAIAAIADRFFKHESFVAALCQWDCHWYATIVEQGYQTVPSEDLGQANWAFPPLFPLIAAGARQVWRMSAEASLILISNLMLLAAFPVLYLYCRRTLGRRFALDVLLLVSCSPFSLYYSVGYTESSFLLLSVAAFFFWNEEKFLLAGIAASLAAASRTVGIFIGLAFLVASVVNLLSKNRGRVDGDIILRQAVALAVIPLGLALFMLYLYGLTGDALAFSHIQTAWVFPADGLNLVFQGLRPPGIFAVIGGAVTLLTVAATVILLLRGRIAEAVFFVSAGVMAIALRVAIGEGIASAPRYLFGLFPVYIALVGLLTRMRIPRRLYLTAALAIQGVYIVAWVAGRKFVI